MTQAATLAQLASSGALSADTSGNVGIGTTTPSTKLEVYSAATTISKINSGNTNAYLQLSTTSDGQMYLANESGAMNFYLANAIKAKIDTGGNLLLGATTVGGNERLAVTKDANAQEVARFINTNASSPWGISVQYTGAAPNGTTNVFLGGYDSVGTKITLRSNGGIGNFSANNVNISDRREKTNFAPSGDYLSKICAIPVQTFNYVDQNLEEDDGLTLGVVAQDVQAVAPELVTETDWGTRENPKMRLSIYQTDLQYALMKCIQELKAELDVCKAEIAALKGV